MAPLKMKTRKAKPVNKSNFAIPEKAPGSGSYPIWTHDLAVKALQLCGKKPEERRVRAAVCRKYKDLCGPKGNVGSKPAAKRSPAKGKR